MKSLDFPSMELKTRTPITMAAALSALLISTACSTATQAPGPSPVVVPDSMDLSLRDQADSVRNSITDADVRFMTGMIGHHAQAVVMSRLAPTNGAGSEIRLLAARIISAQHDEIATMERWLTHFGKPLPDHHNAMHDAHAAHMPGMLTDEQLERLAGSQGLEFEQQYLMLMIQHHQGAITMVEELFASDGAAQNEIVFKLAADISAEQQSEVERMQRMLLARLTTPSR